MESHKTVVPPPEARQLKVVVVCGGCLCQSLCVWVLGSPLCYLTSIPPDSFLLPHSRLGLPFLSRRLRLSFCSEQWLWGCQP